MKNTNNKNNKAYYPNKSKKKKYIKAKNKECNHNHKLLFFTNLIFRIICIILILLPIIHIYYDIYNSAMTSSNAKLKIYQMGKKTYLQNYIYEMFLDKEMILLYLLIILIEYLICFIIIWVIKQVYYRIKYKYVHIYDGYNNEIIYLTSEGIKKSYKAKYSPYTKSHIYVNFQDICKIEYDKLNKCLKIYGDIYIKNYIKYRKLSNMDGIDYTERGLKKIKIDYNTNQKYGLYIFEYIENLEEIIEEIKTKTNLPIINKDDERFLIDTNLEFNIKKI